MIAERCAWSGRRITANADAERLARSRAMARCPECGRTVALSRWAASLPGHPAYVILAPHRTT